MSFFRSCFAPFLRCIGGAADGAPIIIDDDQPQEHEHQPQASVYEMIIGDMQGKIQQLTCQINQLRNEQRGIDADIKELQEKAREKEENIRVVTYSPNYVHEEAERIEGLFIEENLQESETVPTPDQPVTRRLNDDDNYNMNHKNRGQCIIFTQVIFDHRHQNREGAAEIANQVQKTFEKVNFEVTIYQDFKLKSIKRVLKDLSKRDYTEDDCICIFVSTHGQNGILWASDAPYGDYIFEDILCEIPSLVGKPKIIFIQACRGSKVDKGVGIGNSGSSDEEDYSKNSNKTPTRADLFIIYSTPPGFTSWRSWMMPTFCEMMDKYGYEDFLTILTKTNNEISKYKSKTKHDTRSNNAKQICCFDISPRKKIYFR